MPQKPNSEKIKMTITIKDFDDKSWVKGYSIEHKLYEKFYIVHPIVDGQYVFEEICRDSKPLAVNSSKNAICEQAYQMILDIAKDKRKWAIFWKPKIKDKTKRGKQSQLEESSKTA